MRAISFCRLIILFVFFFTISNCWAQITSINIVPQNPTIDDSVIVMVDVSLPTGCDHVLRGPQWFWDDLYGNHHIVLEISYWFINAFCTQWPQVKTVTFNLGKLQADLYSLHTLTIKHSLIFDTIPISSSDTLLELKVTSTISVDEEIMPLPKKFELLQNYPNPFNQSTRIEFTLENSDFVDLTIYDLLGRKIKTLISENLPAGRNSAIWDGKDESGKDVASGIYLYELKEGDRSLSKKLMLLK